MKQVLADTTPLYAAFDPSDQYHARSQTELQQLEQSGTEVLLLYPTLLEAYTLVLQRLGTQQAFINQEPRRKRTGYRSRFAPEPQIRIASPRASPQSSGEYVPYLIQPDADRWG